MLLSRRILDVSRKSKSTLMRRLSRIGARPYLQLRVLQEISELDGTTQTELLDRLCLDAPSLSRIVKVLVDDGLVRRRALDDRRATALQITAAGARELTTLQDQQALLDRQLQTALTAQEKKTLDALLDQLDRVADEVIAGDRADHDAV